GVGPRSWRGRPRRRELHRLAGGGRRGRVLARRLAGGGGLARLHFSQAPGCNSFLRLALMTASPSSILRIESWSRPERARLITSSARAPRALSAGAAFSVR